MTNAKEQIRDFLDRLADHKNWSSGYPSNPGICDDFSTEDGVFTASIKDTAQELSNSLDDCIVIRKSDVPDLNGGALCNYTEGQAVMSYEHYQALKEAAKLIAEQMGGDE